MCKNIILFRFAGSNKECLRNVSQQMTVDNCLVYKSKETGNWYKWEKQSIGRPISLSNEECELLLRNPENKIINWGNYILCDSNNIISNKPSACKNSSNKWLSRKLWQEADIKTPLSSNSVGDMIEFPFIARPYKHARQSEFHVISNLQQLCELQSGRGLSGWYFQKIVEKTCEFRVYVGGDGVLTIFWKGSGDQLLSSNQVWNWLDDVNWNLSNLPPCVYINNLSIFKEDISKIKDECIKATQVLGLDYSGIDVGLNTTTREFNLFESNTDPELTPLPRTKFARYFDSILQ